MVCSNRLDAETAISSNKRLLEEVKPSNLDKLDRCKLSVIAGAVMLTLPV
jgi:hypothetical protein